MTWLAADFMSFIRRLSLIMLRSISRPRHVLYPAHAGLSCCGLPGLIDRSVSSSIIVGGPERFGLRDHEGGAGRRSLSVS